MKVTTTFAGAECGWMIIISFQHKTSLHFSWFVVKPTRKQRTKAIRKAVKRESNYEI